MKCSLRHSTFGVRYSAVRSAASQGFTLLEVLVSMALIATALLSIMELQAQNLDIQSESQFMTLARLQVQERLSWIGADPNFHEGRDSGDLGEDYPEFRYDQEIVRVSSGANLYKVTVRVFTDETKPERIFSVDSFLYRSPR